MSFYLPKFVYDACTEEIEFAIDMMLGNAGQQEPLPSLLLPLCRAYGIITYAVRPSSGRGVKVSDENEWDVCLSSLRDIAETLRRKAAKETEEPFAYYRAANMLWRAYAVLSAGRAHSSAGLLER